jgi:hypothetical protein
MLLTIQDAFRRHPKLVSAFALALALTLFFALRFLTDFIYWSQHHEEPIRPWMTIGYVGKSWDLNPRIIDETAGLPLPVDGRPFTIQEIADERGVPPADIIKKVEEAIAKLKAEKKHD